MVVTLLRRATLFLSVAVAHCLLSVWPALISADDKVVADLLVKDALVSPNQTAVIEARLVRATQRRETAAVGEPLELVQDGKVLATATTDGTGLAKLRYSPIRKGTLKLMVRVAESSRLSATAITTVATWERRMPLLVVEMAALFDPSSREPLPDAADELGKLTRFYYNVIYVEEGDQGDGFRTNDRARQWLATHKFPLGYVLALLPSKENSLGAKLDEFRSAGWTTIRVGIGRSKEFAGAFIQRRLDAVMVPEPAKGDAPKKAKVAREWKEVRKKL